MKEYEKKNERTIINEAVKKALEGLFEFTHSPTGKGLRNEHETVLEILAKSEPISINQMEKKNKGNPPMGRWAIKNIIEGNSACTGLLPHDYLVYSVRRQRNNSDEKWYSLTFKGFIASLHSIPIEKNVHFQYLVENATSNIHHEVSKKIIERILKFMCYDFIFRWYFKGLGLTRTTFGTDKQFYDNFKIVGNDEWILDYIGFEDDNMREHHEKIVSAGKIVREQLRTAFSIFGMFTGPNIFSNQNELSKEEDWIDGGTKMKNLVYDVFKPQFTDHIELFLEHIEINNEELSMIGQELQHFDFLKFMKIPEYMNEPIYEQQPWTIRERKMVWGILFQQKQDIKNKKKNLENLERLYTNWIKIPDIDLAIKRLHEYLEKELKSTQDLLNKISNYKKDMKEETEDGLKHSETNYYKNQIHLVHEMLNEMDLSMSKKSLEKFMKVGKWDSGQKIPPVVTKDYNAREKVINEHRRKELKSLKEEVRENEKMVHLSGILYEISKKHQRKKRN